MSAKAEHPVHPSMLARAEEIQQQINALSARDLQLWSVGILVIVVLTAGMLALIFPNIMWAQRVIHIEHVYLPQLFFGLISLILLFNIYVIGQKLTLNHTRRALINELVLNERLESLSLIDPLTQLLNRRAINELIPREVSSANRSGSPLTFMTIDLDNFQKVLSDFGSTEGNALLVEFAALMKAVFRGGDLLFRQGKDEFLVVMPDTTEEQADAPVQRLLRAVEQWNIENQKGYELSFTSGLAPYVTGADFEDVLRTVDRKMFQKKHKLEPAY